MVIYENFNTSSSSSSSFVYLSSMSSNKWHLRYQNSLGAWLDELLRSTDSECLSALQAKSVANSPDCFEALAVRNAQLSIERIRRISVQVIDSIDDVIDHFPITYDDLKALKANFAQICQTVESVIEMCRREGCDYAPNRKKISLSVSANCEQLVRFVNLFLAKRNINNAQLEATLRKLKENFGELVDHTIRKECEVIATALRTKSSHLCLKWSLLAHWQLTLNDPYICRIFIETHDVIAPLISIASTYSSVSLRAQQEIRAAALRVLTHLCIIDEAVRQIFAQCMTGKCMISLLIGDSCPAIVREAVGLTVRLTSAFIDQSAEQNFSTRIIVNDLVRCLTELAAVTAVYDVFLLVCAALANISFADSDSLTKSDTIALLISASRQRVRFDDIILKDQIVTILANVSKQCPLKVVSSGGLVYLLKALQMRPGYEGLLRPNEVLAIERIQQKVSVAIARLANNRSVAKIIYQLNGVHRLVELCKEAKERNFSDTVLLACIAALRRIALTIGKLVFKELDCLDLIELKMHQSFSLYSSKSESIV